MVKRGLKCVALVLGVVLAFTLISNGIVEATNAKKEKATPAVQVITKNFEGEVVKVDTADKSLTVKGTTGEETFDVSQAKFEGVKDLAELQVGNKVVVSYEEKEGKKVAVTVKKQ